MGVYDDKTIIQSKSRIIEFECLDDQGNDITCSGRIDSPVGMMFDTRVLGVPNSQIPFRYQIWRERARSNTCCWWQTTDATEADEESLRFNRSADNTPDIFSFKPVTVPSGTFQVEVENTTKLDSLGNPTIETIDYPDTNVMGGWEHEVEPSFAIDPKPSSFNVILINGATQIPTKCTLDKASTWNQGLDGSPPCNGAKTKCPYYTGPKFKYIEDEQLAPGQPVLGQSIQELRTYLKNWESYENAQQEWENFFNIPYIWAGDKDKPHILEEQKDLQVGSTDPIMSLVKIFWNPLKKEADLIKLPSEPDNTPNENSNNLTPPSFPTLIGNLGDAPVPNLQITYPPPRFSNDRGTAKVFNYNSFHNKNQKMYLAGTALAGSLIIVLNKSLLTEVPDLLGLNDEEITSILEPLLIKILSLERFSGGAITRSDNSKFWDLPSGLDLKPNAINNILVLTQILGKWVIQNLKVNYNFYHIDVVQDGFEGNITVPSSDSLLISLANMINTKDLTFSIVNISNQVEIHNTYNVGILDRSLSRLVRLVEDGKPLDKRFWGIFQTKTELEGTKTSGSLRWSKFDNCQRYLVELTQGVSAAPIAGLKYAWTAKNIIFDNVEMEIDETATFSRSPKGEYMAHNYIVIKPKNSFSLREPTDSSTLTLDLYEFTANSSSTEDNFLEILNEHGSTIIDNDFLKQGYGGESLVGLSEDMELDVSPHTFTVSNFEIKFTSYTKYDLSYMLECTIPGFNGGKPIGRKWFVGVGEINKTWLTDVEVRYAWSANQYNRPFEPFLYKGGPLADPGAPIELFTNGETTYYPDCGDHEINATGFGSLWFPYDSCNVPTFKVNDEVIQTKLTIPNTLPVDEKYRGPDAKYPYTIQFNPTGFLNPCVWQYSLGTRYRSQARFVGYSRLRGPISAQLDPILYAQYVSSEWDFPSLGNRGRSAVRVFRSMHFREYLFITPAGPRVRLGWLPVSIHTSNRSLFDDKPRTMFENQIQDKSLVSEFLVDRSSFEGQEKLLSLAINSSDDLTDSNTTKETLQAKRASWEQVYDVKRIRTPDGDGTRFPSKGFYFTFKNTSVVWAYRETPPNIARADIKNTDNILNVSNKITGLNIDRPKENSEIEVYDKFNRPVYLGLSEQKYNLTVEDIKFNATNAEIEEYAKIYLNPDLPVYFDRVTGNILPTPNSTSRSTEIQPYAFSGLDFTLEPYFEPISLESNAPQPIVVSGLDIFLNKGELYTEKSIFYYYIDSVDSRGPTDVSETAFSTVGFIKSLSIKDIIPNLLPKKELCFNAEDFLGALTPTINYTYYPSVDKIEVEQFSGIDLNAKDEEVFTCVENTTKSNIFPELGKWLSKSSVKPGEEGFTDLFTIRISLKAPIELRFLGFSYNVKVSDKLETKLKVDPSIEVQVRNSVTGGIITLFNKVAIDLSVGKPPNSISQNIEVPISLYEGLFIDQITIQVGKRDAACDFLLSKFLIKHLRIREVTEELITLEPKYIPTTGYSTGSLDEKNTLPAESREFLNGTISASDVSDRLESSGICEFWQPGAASLEEDIDVATIGKIRRHWAGGFKSVDVNKWIRGLSSINTPNVFFTGSVEDMEDKQSNLHNSMINTINQVLNLTELELNYFVNPYDIDVIINKLNLQVKEFSFRYKLNTGGSSIGNVSSSSRYPLWQFEGFEVCPPTATRTTRCIVAIGFYAILGAAVIADIFNSETPDLCGPTGSLGTFSLIALIQAPPQGSIAGTNLGSTLTTGEANANTFGEKLESNVDDLNFQLNIEEYLNNALEDENKKYNP